MKGTNLRLDELFQKYMGHHISENELAEFSGYVDDPMFSSELQDLLGKAFQKGDNVLGIGDIGRTRLLRNILGVEIADKRTKTIRLWPRFAIAAALATVIFGIGLYYTGRQNSKNISHYANDIMPGKNSATLTLSNGKQIKLTEALNGELAKDAGVVVTKTAVGQLVYEVKGTDAHPNKINTLTTDKGETYILILPDHTKVWLNAASSLTYTTELLEHGVRKVRLIGEAYFQVAKDKAHPFIVESGGQQVEVLGTEFNVNAYSDEAVVRTTLLEGSVKISEDGNIKILSPGNQAINNAGNIKVHEANTSLVTAWKNNNFIFDRLNIQEIMRMISRWYDVEIIYEDTAPTAKFWGSVSRFENVSEVLNALETTGNVHFKIEGRRIFVSR